jgi:hypothetical protein
LDTEFVPCDEDIVLPSGPETDWEDNCGAVQFVEVTNSSVRGGCTQNSTITFTWHVRDECGNSNSVSKSYVVYDTEAPELPELDDESFECNRSVDSDPPNTIGIDNCAPNVVLSGPVDRVIEWTCPHDFVIERTWTATDQCGNKDNTTLLLIVRDSNPPVLSCPAPVISGSCCTDTPFPDLNATDDCDGTIPAIKNETRTDGPCPNTYNLTRTWTATDSCNRTTVCTQVVMVVDNNPPTLTGVFNAT